MKLKYLILLFLIVSIHSVKAQLSLSQTVISSTGNHFSSASLNLSSTCGEAVIATKTSNSMVLTQGFHQPLISSAITSLEQFSGNNFSILVYPNPTANDIFIEMDTDLGMDASITIFDVLGKICGEIVQLNQIKGHSVYQCNLNTYSPGLYFVKIVSSNHQFNKTIRVQKI
jgi:hypothetical protein